MTGIVDGRVLVLVVVLGFVLRRLARERSVERRVEQTWDAVTEAFAPIMQEPYDYLRDGGWPTDTARDTAQRHHNYQGGNR